MESVTEIKKILDGDIQHIGNIEQLLQGDGCGHVRCLQIADVCTAEINRLCKRLLGDAFEFSVIGNREPKLLILV